jgi:hypothetical protein
MEVVAVEVVVVIVDLIVAVEEEVLVAVVAPTLVAVEEEVLVAVVASNIPEQQWLENVSPSWSQMKWAVAGFSSNCPFHLKGREAIQGLRALRQRVSGKEP